MSHSRDHSLTIILAGLLVVAGISLPPAARADDQSAGRPENQTAARADTRPAAAKRTELGSFGIELDSRNTNVRPQDDFFRYANGKWLDTFEIPSDLAGFGSFARLFLRSEEQVKAIIEESAAATDAKHGSLAQKIGDFYNDWMDDKAREARGLDPLAGDLARVKSAKTPEEIAALMGQYVRLGGFTPFGISIQQDSKDPSHYRPHVVQAGLGLPDRDYYLVQDNPRFAAARDAYKVYLEQLMTFAGREEPGHRAEALLALETKLAEAHWPSEETRDVEKTYNKMTKDELAALAPEFPWSRYLEAVGLGEQNEFIVMMPSATAGMARVFAATPVEVWQDYLAAGLIRINAGFLPEKVDDANFGFVSKAVTGAKEKRERWRRGVQLINGNMGEAVGRLYVERHFPPEAKARVDAIVKNLLLAMGERIDQLEWMSPETKARAHEKLSRFHYKIGYPEKWRDYFALDIRRGDLLGNANRSREFEFQYQLSKLDKPVDRAEWLMTPQTVNAYYNPPMNEIVFPAAILQPPFFDASADDAVNYGGIGAVIGHEVGHGFDDQGRKYDGDGVLKDWWTAEDAARFKERSDRLVKEYAAFSPLKGMNINGELTLGENIGDLGGLEIAYHAWKLSLKGQEPPVLDGLTGDQRFFLSFAQIWKGKVREAMLATLITSDPHSPVEFRVNGALRNVDAWYKAFDVKPGDAMYLAPEERVKIW